MCVCAFFYSCKHREGSALPTVVVGVLADGDPSGQNTRQLAYADVSNPHDIHPIGQETEAVLAK